LGEAALRRRQSVAPAAEVVLAVAVATGLVALLDTAAATPGLGVVYLLAVMLVAIRRGELAAFALENEGVHAYLGQVPNIKEAKVVKAAASIVTVEARHASVFGLILKGTSDSISPDGPFDKPFGANRVLKDVTELGFIQ